MAKFIKLKSGDWLHVKEIAKSIATGIYPLRYFRLFDERGKKIRGITPESRAEYVKKICDHVKLRLKLIQDKNNFSVNNLNYRIKLDNENWSQFKQSVIEIPWPHAWKIAPKDLVKNVFIELKKNECMESELLLLKLAVASGQIKNAVNRLGKKTTSQSEIHKIKRDDVIEYIKKNYPIYEIDDEDFEKIKSSDSLSPSSDDESRYKPRSEANAENILMALTEAGYESHLLPNDPSGLRKAKAAIRDACVPKKMSFDAFNHAWKELRRDGKIAGQ